MLYIVAIAVAGILLLQWSGSIPLSSVGGSLTIGAAFLGAALVVGLHEAWTRRRGVVGWVVNIVVTFVGALIAAQLGGMVIALLLSSAATGRSLAATGGPLMSLALTFGMIVTILGAWAALQLVNRWR